MNHSPTPWSKLSPEEDGKGQASTELRNIAPVPIRLITRQRETANERASKWFFGS